jgi:hypothetical protein
MATRDDAWETVYGDRLASVDGDRSRGVVTHRQMDLAAAFGTAPDTATDAEKKEFARLVEALRGQARSSDGCGVRGQMFVNSAHRRVVDFVRAHPGFVAPDVPQITDSGW